MTEAQGGRWTEAQVSSSSATSAWPQPQEEPGSSVEQPEGQLQSPGSDDTRLLETTHEQLLLSPGGPLPRSGPGPIQEQRGPPWTQHRGAHRMQDRPAGAAAWQLLEEERAEEPNVAQVPWSGGNGGDDPFWALSTSKLLAFTGHW